MQQGKQTNADGGVIEKDLGMQENFKTVGPAGTQLLTVTSCHRSHLQPFLKFYSSSCMLVFWRRNKLKLKLRALNEIKNNELLKENWW